MIVTISRQAATNGALVAQLVGERLGLRVYDSHFVEEIARRLQVDPEIVNHFDEVTLNPVESILWEWRSSINEQIYARLMRNVLLRIKHENNAVVVGHGANFVMTASDTLRVRIVAPLELRVQLYIAGEGVDEKEAHRWIHEQDRRRAGFIKKHFHHDIEDPLVYDLVVNLEGLTPEIAADIIAKATKDRAAAGLDIAPTAILPAYKRTLTRHRKQTRPEPKTGDVQQG